MNTSTLILVLVLLTLAITEASCRYVITRNRRPSLKLAVRAAAAGTCALLAFLLLRDLLSGWTWPLRVIAAYFSIGIAISLVPAGLIVFLRRWRF